MKIAWRWGVGSWLLAVGLWCVAATGRADLQIAVSWELITNFTEVPEAFEARLVLDNRGQQELGDTGWYLYFNMAPRRLVPHRQPQVAKIKHLNGDWYRLEPEPGFRLEPGQSIEVRYMGIEPVIKEADAPLGLYFAIHQDSDANVAPRIERVDDYRILPFTRREQRLRGPNDLTPVASPQQRYQDNRSLYQLAAGELPLIVPTPNSIQRGQGDVKLTSEWNIRYDTALESTAQYLVKLLEDRFAVKCRAQAAAANDVVAGPTIDLSLSSDGLDFNDREAYQVQIDERAIRLVGSDAAGVFYAIQSLIALAPLSDCQRPSGSVKLPQVQIQDEPRFGYRGLHVDVSRNFQSLETIQRIIDVIAFYKLNRLLLYTTEDEGWRLEIPGLPELTSIGAERKHTSAVEQPVLHPAYGSGPDAYAAGTHGSGFYTRQQFIDLLRYAAQRHVKIIPEVNFPAHARAAIKAMEARYQRLMNAGQVAAAEEYRLVDPQDTSEYLSAQSYTDNVVSVARDSTYRFYSKVLDELELMYAEAGLTLDEIHTGGDEVAEGAWTGSPLAQRLLAEHPEVDGASNLHTYFFQRLVSDLERRNVRALGWEEVFQRKDAAGKAEPNPQFVGRNVVAYIWNNLFDYDLGYRLANAGYRVVLCNVSNFYFDLAYDNDPQEPGLYWAGFVGERDAWTFAPFNYLTTTFKTALGQPIDQPQVIAQSQPLLPEARQNILGVQAQLWSETIKGREMIEYYMLPKLIGFAESAWAAERHWENMADIGQRQAAMAEGWNRMANAIAQRELPRLAYTNGGYNYRLPPPGAYIEHGKLFANSALPGLEIRYTTDGTQPTAQSSLYREPISFDSVWRSNAAFAVQLRTFDAAGRGSRIVEIQPSSSR
ncbi:MAG: carbohydate-binding domain-containing protein [Pirellulaceae bacterium]|nr:carbohydate-binding domain-containing protein [Pirellulaceae bacterium]